MPTLSCIDCGDALAVQGRPTNMQKASLYLLQAVYDYVKCKCIRVEDEARDYSALRRRARTYAELRYVLVYSQNRQVLQEYWVLWNTFWFLTPNIYLGTYSPFAR